MTSGGIPFVKGHGTQNDFVLLPDPDGALEITDSQVRAVCDRRAGLGADGIIRIAPAPEAGFVMDYRNADGSIAEMCGNGARVFARYLVDVGWQQPGTFAFRTRGGVRTAELGSSGDVSIEMGPVAVGTESKSELAGRSFAGTSVDVGNPHLVCMLEADRQLADLDLTVGPSFDPVLFPVGVNVEFVVPLSADFIRMRVFERGVGETRSCGTGTVAAAAAFRAVSGAVGDKIRVEVPGGSVVVTFSGNGATLSGPAVIVADGTIARDFWERHR